MKFSIISAISLLTIGISQAQAATIIPPLDFNSIDLGEVIIGPLGPIVADDFTTSASEDIGDLNSSVFDNSATGLFTYTHQVTPGVDDISSFAVSFPATGFNGIAGYDFAQADTAGGIGNGTDFEIEFNTDETITWNIADSADSFFDTGATITFFWQSTLGPVGPFGTYSLNDSFSEGLAIGPTPNPPTPEPVSEPSSLGLLTLLGLFMIKSIIQPKNTCS